MRCSFKFYHAEIVFKLLHILTHYPFLHLDRRERYMNILQSIGDFITNGITGIILAIVIILVLIFGTISSKRMKKNHHYTAQANEALVESGGKDQKPKVYIAGSKWVSPFHVVAKFFLGSMQIVCEEVKSTRTSTKVPVEVSWNA